LKMVELYGSSAISLTAATLSGTFCGTSRPWACCNGLALLLIAAPG